MSLNNSWKTTAPELPTKKIYRYYNKKRTKNLSITTAHTIRTNLQSE